MHPGNVGSSSDEGAFGCCQIMRIISKSVLVRGKEEQQTALAGIMFGSCCNRILELTGSNYIISLFRMDGDA